MKYKIFLMIFLCIISSVSITVGVYDDLDYSILINSRLPRLLSLILSGIGISLAGLIIQQLSKNKFASPSVVGINDCAILGLTIALLIFGNQYTVINITIGFIFACIGTFIILKLFDLIIIKDVMFIPLIGMMFGKIISAISLFMAYKFNIIQDIKSWILGDFSGIMKGNYELLYIIIPLVIISYMYSNSLTMIGLGDKMAYSVGIDFNKIKILGIVIVSLISASTILTAGNLPFLGLVIPNITTIIHGANINKNLSYICLYGAIVTVICDMFARTLVYPFEIPISMVLGIIGSIFFVYIILQGGRVNE